MKFTVEQPGPKVLIVDDDDEIRSSLRALLERLGVEVVGEASGGAEGVAKAWTLKPDMILMDFRMEDMDGVQATEAIKESLPDVKVIFLSAYEDAILQTDARVAGAFDYIVKGASPAQIFDRIVAAWQGEPA